MADKRENLLKQFLDDVIEQQEDIIRKQNQSKSTITRNMTAFIHISNVHWDYNGVSCVYVWFPEFL